jgi:tRNA U34 2-thiouridine synthase MnmA/TrmU
MTNKDCELCNRAGEYYINGVDEYYRPVRKLVPCINCNDDIQIESIEEKNRGYYSERTSYK